MGQQQSRTGERRRKSANEVNSAEVASNNVKEQPSPDQKSGPNFKFQPTSHATFHSIPHTISKTVSPNISQNIGGPKNQLKTEADQNNSLFDDIKVTPYSLILSLYR